jgi:hypothetical protein
LAPRILKESPDLTEDDPSFFSDTETTVTSFACTQNNGIIVAVVQWRRMKGCKMVMGWIYGPDVYYRKVIHRDDAEVSLDADMIRLLIAIDARKSLYQIAEEVGMETAVFKKTLSKLLQQRLIEPVQKDIPVLDETFFEALKINLSKAVGPIAEILMEEASSEMDLDTSSISVHQAAELIAQLSLEVPDEDDRLRFKKSMMAILNKIK